MGTEVWFIYVQGKTQGPLTTVAVAQLLTRRSVFFEDFIWCRESKKWIRIYECKDFAELLPPRPKHDPIVHGVDETSEKRAPSKSGGEKKPVFPKIRRFERIPIKAKILIQGNQEKGATEHEILNISEGGLFVETKQPLPIGIDIKFRLESPSFPKALEMTGVVIRHAVQGENSGFGIEFTRVNPSHRRILQQYAQDQLVTSNTNE